MTKPSLSLCVVALAFLPNGAKAQRAQNFDISLMWATASLPVQTVPATGVTIYNSWPISCCSEEFGYQVARASAGTLWVEYAHLERGGSIPASIPSSGNRALETQTLGIRWMVPVLARLSFFGIAGGGDGDFTYPRILAVSPPYLMSHSTTHGVFAWGGGVDVRLSKRVSIRGEVRDLVSGKNLSGSKGVNHVLIMGGVGFHF